MGLFDLIFDELGKEIKEAPGWLSLIFVLMYFFSYGQSRKD